MVQRLVNVFLRHFLDLELVHVDVAAEHRMKAARWDGLWSKTPQKPMQRTWN